MTEGSFNLDLTMKSKRDDNSLRNFHVEIGKFDDTLMSIKDPAETEGKSKKEIQKELENNEKRKNILDYKNKIHSLANDLGKPAEDNKIEPKEVPLSKKHVLIKEDAKVKEEEMVSTLMKPSKSQMNKNSRPVSISSNHTAKVGNVKRFTKIRLVKTKILGEKTKFKPEIYLEGDFEIDHDDDNEEFDHKLKSHSPGKAHKHKKQRYYISIKDFNKELFPFATRPPESSDNPLEMQRMQKEFSLFKHCEFFTLLFRLSKLLNQQFKKFLKNCDLHSFFIFVLHKKFVNFNFSEIDLEEDIVRNLIKGISLEVLIEYLPKYVEFISDNFFKPIKKEFGENFLDSLTKVLGKEIISDLKSYQIYNDVSNIVNKCFNFLLMKWRDRVEDKLHGANGEGQIDVNTLQTNYFYCLLKKIEHYFKNFFPYCCGNADDDQLIYAKSPFVFCLNCKIVICNNCFRHHKHHSYFDFANFKRNKDVNIFSPKEMFLNYRKDENHFSIKDKDNRIEDLIITTILNKFKTRVSTLFSQGRTDPEVLQAKRYFSVFDFIEIFLLEHLFKMMFPFTIGHYNNVDGKNEFLYTKMRISEDSIFTKAILHGLKKVHKLYGTGSKFYDFKEVPVEEYYSITLEEYNKHKLLKSLETRNNRFLIEDLYYNKLAMELQVSKTIICSNSELNFEIPTNKLSSLISQANSPKQYYSKLLTANLQQKDDHINHPKDRPKSDNNRFVRVTPKTTDDKLKYNKLVFDFAGTMKNDVNLTTTFNKYDIQNLGTQPSSVVRKDNKKATIKSFNKKLNLKFKEDPEMYGLEEIIPKSLNINKDLKDFNMNEEDLLFLDTETTDPIRVKYKSGYNSKYDLICTFIEDILHKISKYGVVKFKK